MFFAKDFIETAERLVFAVVENGVEQGRILSFLRYVRTNGDRHKVNTEQANRILQKQYPDFLYYSKTKDTALHAVPVARIKTHHQPRLRCQELIKAEPVDAVHRDFKQLIGLYRQQGVDITAIGITGSLLLNAQNAQSDIDLVIYDRKTFNEIRAITGQLIADNHLQDLSLNDWEASYHRRGCDFSLEDYIWHEQRKLNKAIINGRKFDLSLVTDKSKQLVSSKKRGHVKLTATIIDAEQGFDYPAIFKIDHPEISEIVCYTATYVGQAFTGEIVEAAGLLEQTDTGEQRLLVGSTREATGEYIKVVKCRYHLPQSTSSPN